MLKPSRRIFPFGINNAPRREPYELSSGWRHKLQQRLYHVFWIYERFNEPVFNEPRKLPVWYNSAV
jgi:hypothetical protein